jgi:K+-transporting ATPase ATPase A chain
MGKPIQAFDVQMAMLAVLVFPLTVLVFTGISAAAPFGTSGVTNPGPHGLTQMLYAFVSGAGNNGSAFGGLGANTAWYNATTGVAMAAGRYLVIVPVLAIAGNLAGKKRVPPSPGTFPVTGPLFGALLVGVILIVGALTFFPALSLGPVVEHLVMQQGRTF